jgi:MYXO-CTERM domain-containing protein
VAYSFAGVPAPLLVGLFLLALPAGRRVRRYMERMLSLIAAA